MAGPCGCSTWCGWSRRGAGPAVLRGFLLDISERKNTEEALRRHEVRSAQTQHHEALGVLAGGIAHDFNNLLTTMLGYTDLARSVLPDQSSVQPYLAEVLVAGHRAADLTRQVLDFAGKGHYVLRSVALSELVEQMGPLLATVVSPRAALQLELSSAVPPIQADPSQIRQIVLNLLTNASEALGEQDGTVVVRTDVIDLDAPRQGSLPCGADLPAGRYALLEVADTGKGMDQATLSRAFEPFFTTKFTGRGMGLAAVLGIVRSLNGTIQVSSMPGQGASFQVLLPAAQAGPITGEVDSASP
jgi:signal transduction histidine kinase